jgi:hypothetical protein
MLENRVLRRIFGPKRKEVAGSWRRLQNEKLHNIYASPDVIRMIKSRRVRWAGWEDANWMYLADDTDRWRAVVNTVMNRRVL